MYNAVSINRIGGTRERRGDENMGGVGYEGCGGDIRIAGGLMK